MDVVIAELAVAGLPEPMPVVMELGTGERTHGRWTGPEIVIDIGRSLVGARPANRTSTAVHDAAGQLHFAQLALLDVFNGRGQRGVGAVLGAALADAAGFACHLYNPAAFTDIVADRFFNINVLARLHRPDGRQRVPMIGRRHKYCV